MKRSIILVVIMGCLLAVVCLADQMGIVGEIFAGRSGVTRGFLSLHNGAGSTTPAYIKMESANGTYQYLFSDNDGRMRIHTAVPVADANGTLLEFAIADVNSITADLNTLAGSDYYIFNSSGAALDPNLADGTLTGEIVVLSCKVAGNNIDVSVENHVTSNPEVIRLDTAKEWVKLLWDGTDWVEIDGNGQTYP